MLFNLTRYIRRRMSNTRIEPREIHDFSSHHQLRGTLPSVNIIIPTRNKKELLKACVDSIVERTTYPNYRITVVNNQSDEPDALSYLNSLAESGINVIHFNDAFNYSAICNYAINFSKSEFICLLNNDTQVVTPDWLSSLVEHAAASGIGIVGSKLVYPTGSPQHLGVALGMNGIASNIRDESIAKALSDVCFEVSAVTFACALFRRELFQSVGALDESLVVGLNDVDYCTRVREADLKNVVCNKSTLIHIESQSRRNPKSLLGGFRAFVDISRYLKKHGLPEDDQFFFSR